jgi:predicted TIM-barrel fold metal-dependent hydrolase
MTRIVDLQGHCVPDAQFRVLSERADEDSSIRGLVGMLQLEALSSVRRLDDARIAAMDGAGIDVQVVSMLPPGAVLGENERAGEIAAELNDDLLTAAGQHPDRFLVLASLPWPDVEASVAEVERLAGHPLVRGVLIDAHSSTFTIEEACFEPIYAKLAEHGLLAVLHVSHEPFPQVYNDWMLSASVGAMTTTTLGGLRLILSGMLDRVPTLDLVIPHLGGLIPQLVQRIVDQSFPGDAEHDFEHYLRNRIWTDSCNYWHPALQCAIDTFGSNRIMLGSDYPFRGSLDVCVRDIRTADIPDATKDAILGGTAERWFGVR